MKHVPDCTCDGCMNGETSFVRVSECDWIQLQVTLAELKSRVHDLETRLNGVDSSLQLLVVDAGY